MFPHVTTTNHYYFLILSYLPYNSFLSLKINKSIRYNLMCTFSICKLTKEKHKRQKGTNKHGRPNQDYTYINRNCLT